MTHTPTAPLSDLPRIILENLENCRKHDLANATLVLSREMLEKLDGLIGKEGGVSQDELALKTIIAAAEHAYDTLYQHGDLHLANELSNAIVIARKEVPLFASLDNSLPLETPTDKLVSDFAVALKSKLNSAREKYGHEDEAWRDSGWLPELLEQLETHLAKGDPRDVAAYCAFAWYHNWSLAALRAPQHDRPQPMEWQSAVGDGRMNNDWQLYVDGSLRRYIENRFDILERRITELEK